MIKSYGPIIFDKETGEVKEVSGRYHGDTYYDILYDPKKDGPEELERLLDMVYKQGQEEIRSTFKKLLDIKDRRY